MTLPRDSQWEKYSALCAQLNALSPADRLAVLGAMRDQRQEDSQVLSLVALHFALPPEPDRVRTGEQIGNFILGEVIGAGGMGIVYLAQQQLSKELNRDVAVKLMSPALTLLSTDNVVKRFVAEIQTLITLEYEGIVRIYDGGLHENPATHEQLPFLAMELVRDGKPITDYAAEHGLSIRERLILFSRVCAAVHRAHGHRILHRDLKPDNILVDRNGTPFIIDFGLAQAYETLLPSGYELAVAGTPAYMSPEQVVQEFGAMTPKSDAYALGIVFYELLSGQRPYLMPANLPLDQLGKIIVESQPPLLGSHHEALRGELEAIAATALAKHPDDRLSVKALESRIETYLQTQRIRLLLQDEQLGLASQEVHDTTAANEVLPWHESDICPYRGLETFHTEHARFFYGRETLTDWLLDKLRPAPGTAEAPRFLAIVGPSGSGKSSVAHAGLLAALQRGALPESDQWAYILLRPLANPLESLAIALAANPAVRDCLTILGDLVNTFTRVPETLHQITRLVLHGASSSRRLLLLVDQFEELFTLCQDDRLRAAFISNLLHAANTPGGQTVVVITMRADFYGRCATDPTLAVAVSQQQMLVGPMAPADLRRAIELPVRQTGCTFEAGLVETLMDEVGQQAASLPLLQDVLRELWERRQGPCLTLAAYRAIGGVSGALEQRANDLYEHFDAEDQELCRRIFLRLIQPGEGVEDTKRRIAIQALHFADADVSDIERIIQRLADERLIVTDAAGPGDDRGYIEVAHETLLRQWRQLRAWIEADREAIRIQRRLSDAAAEWDVHAQDDAYLYRGPRLREAETCAFTQTDLLNTLEVNFLRASQALRDEELAQESERQKRLKRLAIIAIIAGTFAILLAIFVFFLLLQTREAYRIADEGRRQAELQTHLATGQRLIAQGRVTLVDNPLRGTLLAAEAVRRAQENGQGRPAAETFLWQALTHARGYGLGEPRSVIWTVAISPDRRWGVAGSRDGRLQLWDLTTSDPAASTRILPGHDSEVLMAVISPDSRWLASGSADRTVRLWDLKTSDPSRAVYTLSGHTGAISTTAISADSRWLVSGSADRTVRLWDLKAPNPSRAVYTLSGHTGAISTTAISADSRWLVSGSADRTMRLWDLHAPDPNEAAQVLKGHTARVWKVAISADSRWLVSGSADNTVRVWNLQATDPRQTVRTLIGHTSGVLSLSISPDSRWAVSGSRAGRIRLWDLLTPDPSKAARVLQGHTAAVEDLAISSDSRWLLSGSRDHTARLWDLGVLDPTAATRTFPRHTTAVQALTSSSDGRWLLSGTRDGTIRLWDLAKPPAMAAGRVLQGHTGAVGDLALSPDGNWAISGGQDGHVRLWDLTVTHPASPPRKLQGGAVAIQALAISSDSRWVFSGSRDGTIRLWDLANPEATTATRILKGHTGAVWDLALSPDNRWLVSGSEDHTVRLWALTDTEPVAPPRVFQGHSGAVLSVAVSADGRWLFSSSDSRDRTIRIWDLAKPEATTAVRIIKGHARAVRDLALSSDRRWLISVSADHTIRLWDLLDAHPAASSRVIHGHTSAVLSVTADAAGRGFFTGSENGRMYFWPLQIEDIVDYARKVVGRNFSQEEWQRYFPAESYRETFP